LFLRPICSRKVGEIQSQLIDGRERTKRLKSWKDEAKAKTEELVRVNQHLSEQNANIKTDLEFSNAKMQHILEQIEYEREKNENLRQENEEWQRNLGHVVDIPPVMEEFGNLDTIDRQDFGSERKLLQPSQSNNTKIQRPGASSMKRQQSLKCFLPEPKKSTSSSDINQSKRPTSKHSIAKFVRIS
jgi:chromosome segregation ATPase